jgi:DNA-binding phage protein
MAAQPFMTPAIERGKEALLKAIKTELKVRAKGMAQVA